MCDTIIKYIIIIIIIIIYYYYYVFVENWSISLVSAVVDFQRFHFKKRKTINRLSRSVSGVLYILLYFYQHILW